MRFRERGMQKEGIMMWLIIVIIVIGLCLIIGIAAYLALLGASKMQQREIDKMFEADKRELKRQGMIND